MKAIWDVNTNYEIPKDRKLGNTYTHPTVSKMITDLIQKEQRNILDPSVGTGSFYYSVNDSGIEYDLYDCYDIDNNALSNINKINNKCSLYNEDFLTKKINRKYSLIITNPPYISFNNFPCGDYEDKLEYMEAIKDTLDYDKLNIKREEIEKRSDIYIYFYLKALSLLEDDGKLVFLCSDKWLETKYGKVLRDLLSTNYNLDRIITSNFYPFFRDDTNAVGTFISKKDKNSKTIINSIDNTNFILKDKIITRDESIRALNSIEPKNNLVMYYDSFVYTNDFNTNNSLLKLNNIINIESGDVSFNKSDIIEEKKENYTRLFYQKQSRVNKPAIYRENITEADLNYFVRGNYKVFDGGVFYTPGIDLFPRLFTYKGKCFLSTKYINISGVDIDDDLIPILMNNVVTLLNLECFIKNGTKRSGRKNKRGVIKELNVNTLLEISSLDFRKINKEQKNIILGYYEKYRNLTFMDYHEMLANEYYMLLQKYLFNIFNIDNIDLVIKNLLYMYNVRTRDLKELKLELID